MKKLTYDSVRSKYQDLINELYEPSDKKQGDGRFFLVIKAIVDSINENIEAEHEHTNCDKCNIELRKDHANLLLDGGKFFGLCRPCYETFKTLSQDDQNKDITKNGKKWPDEY